MFQKLTKYTLFDILVADIGLPVKRDGDNWWSCPLPDCSDSNPSFHITPDGKHFKCFSCGQSGDAIDYLQKKYISLTFSQAKAKADELAKAERATGSTCSSCSPKTGGMNLSKSLPVSLDEHVSDIVKRCSRAIFQKAGESALARLKDRGLNENTIREARLGYNAEQQNSPLFFFPGESIVIPWHHRGDLMAVNCRRLSGEPKYQLIKGSHRGCLYPPSTPNPSLPVLLCEGELDALLANQVAGKLIQAYTVGSASASPTPSALAALSCCSRILLAFDADAAGDLAAIKWQALLPRAKRHRPPATTKDLSGLGPAKLLRWIQTNLR